MRKTTRAKLFNARMREAERRTPSACCRNEHGANVEHEWDKGHWTAFSTKPHMIRDPERYIQRQRPEYVRNARDEGIWWAPAKRSAIPKEEVTQT